MSATQRIRPARVDAARGVHWVRDGWQVFCANAGMWLVLTLIWLLINLALQMLPLVGFLLALFVAPALCGGLLLCARDSLTDRSLDVGQLFAPITLGWRRDPVLIQGALFLLMNLVVMVVTIGLMAGTAGTAMVEHQARMAELGGMGSHGMDPGQMMEMALPVLIAALIGLSLQLVLWALFFYAIPLVLFDGTSQAASLAASGRAVLRNWLALLVFGLVWLVLALAASIPLLLGWLILLPITFGAWFASYRDIFAQWHADRAASQEAVEPPEPAA